MRIETLSQWLGIAVTLCAGVWFILKLWIRPLEAKIESLERSLTDKLSEVEEQIEKIDERQRRHTGDSSKHVNDQWRADVAAHWNSVERRLERIEEGLLKLLSGRGN